MINGHEYAFESIKVRCPSGPIVKIEDINYSVEQDTKPYSTPDGEVIGFIKGEIKTPVKLVITRDEFEKINSYAVVYGGILNLPPLPFQVSYGNAGQPKLTDQFKARLNKWGDFGGKKGTDILKVSMEGFAIGTMKLNGKPVFTASI